MIRKTFILAILGFVMGSTAYAQANLGEFPWQLGRKTVAPAHFNQAVMPAPGLPDGSARVDVCDEQGRVLATVNVVVCSGEAYGGFYEDRPGHRTHLRLHRASRED